MCRIQILYSGCLAETVVISSCCPPLPQAFLAIRALALSVPEPYMERCLKVSMRLTPDG